ncbi:myelin-associated glycoprotein [Xyrichtys novacula]|uniref:Myelin-associated glycoprotein n=1 Tax=Xyrichtys novacula TaxID=13765 RepID=A0AAV1FKU3_XYRNO|nr:myelin-associated glycoprotein [Xyrichtys novacula]
MDKDTTMLMMGLLLVASFSPVLNEQWTASVVNELEVLVSSCVAIPCSFTHPEGSLSNSRLRGIWHVSDKRDQRVFSEDPTTILENYRGRTKLLGHLSQGNCTLEITEIKDHDNGPFCFRIELAPTSSGTLEKFSFVQDCATLIMQPDPPKPEMTHPKTAIQGHPFTVTCTVAHTCPSHAPKLTWSRLNSDPADGITEVHRKTHSGIWEVQSILTFIAEEKDDHSEVTCTSTFNGGKSSSKTLTLFVKRTENYNHIIIPAVVGIGITAIFAVFCIFMVKKYKTRIAELQRQDGSMWNRLSRMSRRIRSNNPGPSHSEHRRSIWSRFSRRPRADMVNQMPNNVTSNTCSDKTFSKPRFPSPKRTLMEMIMKTRQMSACTETCEGL